MYVDISVLHRGNKTYTRALLRESYREGGKVKHRTIANISKCSLEEIEAIQLALRHKDALGNLGSIKKAIKPFCRNTRKMLLPALPSSRQITWRPWAVLHFFSHWVTRGS